MENSRKAKTAMVPTRILVSKILLRYCAERMLIQNINPNKAAYFFGAIGIKFGLILRSGRTNLLKSFTGVYSILVNTLSANSITKNQKMSVEPVRKTDAQQIKATSANVRVSFSLIKQAVAIQCTCLSSSGNHFECTNHFVTRYPPLPVAYVVRGFFDCPLMQYKLNGYGVIVHNRRTIFSCRTESIVV
jgi:hypothetical protein